jgi:hypothetical protein
MVNRRDRQEAADLIEGVLDLVGRGDLVADGAAGIAAMRRLEGAETALRVMAQKVNSSEGGRS